MRGLKSDSKKPWSLSTVTTGSSPDHINYSSPAVMLLCVAFLKTCWPKCNLAFMIGFVIELGPHKYKNLWVLIKKMT